MARVLVSMVLILSVLAGTAGCSGFQVKGDMALLMQMDTATAAGVVGAAASGALTPEVAREYLKGPALELEAYYQTATVNGLEYVFSGSKAILVTAVFYNDLRALALDSREAANRADACSDEDAQKRAVRFARSILGFNLARLGVK